MTNGARSLTGAKKKELVGDFKTTAGSAARKAIFEEVRVHDFLIKELGRAVPYGIYDLAANAGWVSVGIDHDTAEFAVQTIRSWRHSTERRGDSVQAIGTSSVSRRGGLGSRGPVSAFTG